MINEIAIGILSVILAAMLIGLYSYREFFLPYLMCSLVLRNKTLRVFMASVVRIGDGSRLLLIKNPWPESFSPLGGVIKFYPSARLEERFEFRSHSEIPNLQNDLRGFLPARNFSSFMQWFQTKQDREIESITRGLIEKLKEIGLTDLANTINVIPLSFVRYVHDGVNIVPGAGYYQFRYIEVYELNPSDEKGRDITEKLFAAAQQNTHLLTVTTSEIIWQDVLFLADRKTRSMISTESVESVINPFIAGNPVRGQLFVGREEIFRRLEELWGIRTRREASSVVLYGHRRMGKTSILQNLNLYFSNTSTFVAQFTMQRAGRMKDTGELLYYLSLAIFDALQESGIEIFKEPEEAAFHQDGYRAFNQFLRQVKPLINQHRVILTIDEFELIEIGIAEGRLDAELLVFLRGVIQSEPWLILALAGLHTLQEMASNYWNPLFASITPLRVSFLNEDDAGQLLINPTDDFPLRFESSTVNHIFNLVKGQPFLTQLIGQSLVSRYNKIVFEEGKSHGNPFTPDDVDAIVNDPIFYELGSYYFTGVWGQAEKSEPNGQTSILLALAKNESPVEKTGLFTQANLSPENGEAALAMLRQHDVVSIIDEQRVDFAVPLMRRWIQLEKLQER